MYSKDGQKDRRGTDDPWVSAFLKREAKGIRLYDEIAHRRWRKLIEIAVGNIDSGLVLKTDGWNEAIGGACSLSQPIFDRGLQLAIMDISLGVLSRISGPCLLVNADLRHLPFGDKAIDCILDVSTSDHCPFSDMETIIGQYARVLRAGGRLLLIHNSSYSVVWQILRLVGHSSPAYSGFPPVYYFSPRRVRKLLISQGFKVSRVYYSNLFGWAKRLINGLPISSHRSVVSLAGLELYVPNMFLWCFARQHVVLAQREDSLH